MEEDIKTALTVLEAGGTILYPTDTIWGIGCDATNPEAVKKVYEIKKRKDTKNMLVLIDITGRIIQYVKEVPETARDMIEVSENPITIIYPNAINLAPNLLNLDGSIGIRVTRDEFCKSLISRFKKPIVSTSANLSSEEYPNNFKEINEKILKGVDYVVKWRQKELTCFSVSSIVKLELNGEIKIIRK